MLLSIDYSHLISWLAWSKHGKILNRTQMQKILFICYGLYLAKNGVPMFNDDQPKAWPYGPVFPKVYRDYNEIPFYSVPKEKQEDFLKDKENLMTIVNIVKTYHNTSGRDFTFWSHQKGSPWAETVFSGDELKWGKVISDELIRNYFKGDWNQGL